MQFVPRAPHLPQGTQSPSWVKDKVAQHRFLCDAFVMMIGHNVSPPREVVRLSATAGALYPIYFM